jgi:rubrerythrin
MAPLRGSQTDGNLRHAFSDEGRLNRLYLSFQQAAEAEGHGDLAAVVRSMADGGAGNARGHLDFLAWGYDTSAPKPVAEFATEVTAMTEDQIAMYAGMARTAYDEGFEEIAGWFETLAKAGRSHARRMRHALENRNINS